MEEDVWSAENEIKKATKLFPMYDKYKSWDNRPNPALS